MKTVLVGVLVGGLLYMGGQYIASQPQRIQQEEAAEREVTVEGHGEIEARPDVARITLGTQSGVQPTAEAALQTLTANFNRVVDTLEQLKIDEEDIKTTNLSVQPVYDFQEGRQNLRGFEASESVIVTIRDLKIIGDVVARSTAAGANQVGGINLEIDKPDSLQEQAQQKAIKDAREKAERLADALNVRLGPVKSFSTSPQAQPPIPFAAERSLAAPQDAGSPPVPTGSQTIESRVLITYQLR